MADFNDSWRAGGTGRGAYILASRTAAQVPLTIQLYTGQTANAFTIKNAAGTEIFYVTPNGNVVYIGEETIADSLTVDGNILGHMTLTIDGASTLTGAITAGSTLSVAGTTTLAGATATSLTISGATSLNSLTVVDATVSNFLQAEDVRVNDTLAVGGHASILGGLAVHGAINSLTVLKLANGTVSVPSLTFISDETKGIYNSGTNAIGITIDRTERLDISATAVTAILAATGKVHINGATTRTGTTECLDIDATIDTTTATDDVNCATITADRAALDTGGTRGWYVQITTGDQANAEWSYAYGGKTVTSACATATSNSAVFFADAPTVDAQCNDYGIYISSGYDYAGYFDGAVHAGALDITGLVIAPAAAGTVIDLQLETEWVSGTLLNADFAGATVQAADMLGIVLDFNTNLAGVTDKDVAGYTINTPALTQSSASTTNYLGYRIVTAGALVQDTLEGTINWTGLHIQLPNITQTTGTVASYGVYINGGTLTSGTEYALFVDKGLTRLDDHIQFGAGVATVAATYSIGRNADATNLLQFNVPTGAGFKWSVNGTLMMQLNGASLGFSTMGGTYILDGLSTNIDFIFRLWNGATSENVLYITADRRVGVNVDPTAALAAFHVQEIAGTSGVPNVLTVTGAANTGLTAATEAVGVNFDLDATKTWATGAGPLATQREFLIQAPTYAGGVAALTITRADTVSITGAPTAGANMTLTEANALYVGGQMRLDSQLRWGAGVAVTAGQYSVGRDADATNQLHLNVPTGASIEFSVNDVSIGQIDLTFTQITDDRYFAMGNTLAAPDAILGWNTAQTVDGVFFGLATGQNTLVIAEYGDRAFDFAHGAQSNPTVFVHSATQNTTQWLSLTHNAVNGVISTGAGNLLLSPNGGSVVISQASVGGIVGLSISNSDDTNAASHGRVRIANGGDSGGDAYVELAVGAGPTTWVAGLDNSDSDALVFSVGDAIGTANVLRFLGAQTTGAPTTATFTRPANTGITAATESIGFNFNGSATQTWAAGAGPLATQREFIFQAPTYVGNVAGALTISRADTVSITGAPIQGANMTLSEANALYVGGRTRINSNLVVDNFSSISMGAQPTAGVVLTVGANSSTMVAATTAWRDLQVGGNVTELANAAITDIVGAYFNTFTITDGGGTETVGIVSTVYITGAPTAGTAPTNGPYALFVDAGEVRIDGGLGDTTNRVASGFFVDLTVTNTITGSVSGTSATVTGATQASITTCSNLTTVGTIGTGVWQGTTIKANYLQQAAADLGDVDITVDLSNSNAGNVTNLTIDGTLTGATLAITDINIGGATIETGSVSTLNIKNGTAPTALVADQIQIYSTDTSDNTATLALFLEQAVEDIGTFTASHKIKVLINGTAYWLQLDAVA